jgi:uncharacterized OB-fold protein
MSNKPFSFYSLFSFIRKGKRAGKPTAEPFFKFCEECGKKFNNRGKICEKCFSLKTKEKEANNG